MDVNAVGVNLQDETQDVSGKSTHYIVLIDDSGDMGQHFNRPTGGNGERLQTVLTELLFGPENGQPPFRRDLFDPASDILSLAFYGIGKSAIRENEGCGKTGNKLSADILFQWVLINGRPDKDMFYNLLRQELSSACRAKNNLSPIATAQYLALLEANKHLQDSGLEFEKIVVVNVDNRSLNFLPSEELVKYRTQFGVAGVGEAITNVAAVRNVFEFEQDTSDNGYFAIASEKKIKDSGEVYRGVKNVTEYSQSLPSNRQPLYIIFSEIKPKGISPELLLDVPGQITFDMVAASNDKIKLIPKGIDYVRLVMNEKYLWTNFNWQEQIILYPGNCLMESRELCQTKINETLFPIPLLHSLSPEHQVSSEYFTAKPESYRFKARFHYQAPGVYEHLYYTTSPRVVNTEYENLGKIEPYGFWPERQITPRLLTENWQASDTVLSANTLINRIRSEYTREMIIIAVIAVVFTGFLIWIVLRYLLPANYIPRIEWQSDQNQLLRDFNSESGLVLAGALIVHRSPAHGLARFLRKLRPEPDVELDLTLTGEHLERLRLVHDDVDILGFEGDAEHKLATLRTHSVKRRLSERNVYPVFFAADLIRDLRVDKSVEIPAQTLLQCHLQARLLIRGKYVSSKQYGFWHSHQHYQSVTHDQVLALVLIAKQAPQPLVHYHTSLSEFAYRYDQQGDNVHSLGVYRFSLRNLSLPEYTVPFKAEYALRADIDGSPLAQQNTLTLANGGKLLLHANQEVDVSVLLRSEPGCLSNPPASSAILQFNLIGAAPAKARATQQISLLRDPTRANAVVHMDWQGCAEKTKPSREIYWSTVGTQELRWHSENGQPIPTVSADKIEPYIARFFRIQGATDNPMALVKLKLANSARFGDGYVRLEIKRLQLVLAPSAIDAITLDGEQSAGTLDAEELAARTLLIEDRFHQRRQVGDAVVTVCEGDEPAELTVMLQPGVIKEIADGELSSDLLRLDLHAELLIQPDSALSKTEQACLRELKLTFPLGLETIPSLNYLSIDFGTSAIAVARAASLNKDYTAQALLDLPRVNVLSNGEKNSTVQNKDLKASIAELENYETYQADNEGYFLPSPVVFDAADRQQEGGITYPAGFPKHAKASLIPGQPGFVSLPATSSAINQGDGRLVFSLKSWLAAGQEQIHLAREITLEDSGRRQSTTHLSIDLALKSALAALINAYIKPAGAAAERVVLSFPNTYNPFQRERFIKLAYEAIGSRLELPNRKWLVGLSESDAVAYYDYYVRHSHRQLKRDRENILIYDLGAGTLDLSIIRLLNITNTAPLDWQVKARIGVATAGNYLDGLLVRLIHACLLSGRIAEVSIGAEPKESDAGAEAIFHYRYPIVCERVPDDKQAMAHRQASVQLRSAILEAKHRWDGKAPFTVKLGNRIDSKSYVLMPYENQEDSVDRLAIKCDPDRLMLWCDSERANDVYLSIPSRLIHASKVLSDHLDFISADVIKTTLECADLNNNEIQRVVISGRGSRWPGLVERIRCQFNSITEVAVLDETLVSEQLVSQSPDQHQLLPNRGLAAKGAVALGAIAFQSLRRGTSQETQGRLQEDVVRPQLVLHLMPSNRMIQETEWRDQAIAIQNDTQCCLLQTMRKTPIASEINSIRRHYYQEIPGSALKFREYFDIWGPYAEFRIRVSAEPEQAGGKFAIELSGPGATYHWDFTALGAAVSSLRPPWPVGEYCLSSDPLVDDQFMAEFVASGEGYV